MRIGLVGCGRIGIKRAEAARGHELVTVFDTDRSRADALARRCGAAIATNWMKVVEAPVDLVVVATSHDSLAQISLAAVEAGKHVLVEKPAARTAAELAPLVEAATRHGRVVKVGFNHRFHPAVLEARRIVDSGDLGPLMWVRGRYGHGGRPGYEKEWRCDPGVSGGGELLDQGSHLIDLSRWFLGELRVEYASTPTYYWDAPVEDNCFLGLQATGGQTAWLHASWTDWKNTFCFEICGRQGKLVIDGLGGSYGIERLTQYQMSADMGPPETLIREYPFPDTSFARELAELEAAIEKNRQPIGNLADALANLEIVGRAYAQRQP